MISEENIYQALNGVNDQELFRLENQADYEHVFSKRFDRKMKKLIQKSKKNTTIRSPISLKKRIVTILVVAILILATSITVLAVGGRIVSWISEKYEEFTHIFFRSEVSEQEEQEWISYAPTDLPPDFTLTVEEKDNTSLYLYENGDSYLAFSQTRVNDVSMDINTEGVPIEETTVHQYEAKYYSNQGIQNVCWQDGTYFYHLFTTLDKNTLFQVAESVSPIDTDKNKH